MDERMLKTGPEENDLGISFNEKLTFEQHINAKVNKANSLVGMLRRTFIDLDKDVFKLLFISIVRPHLEYGAPIWNPYTKKLINLIENVQRRATKLIPGMSNFRYRERFEKMELPTLQYRRYRGDMIEVHKLSHHFYDQKTANNILDFEQAHSHNIRGYPFKIFKLNCKKDRITEQWNNLPLHIATAPIMNAFKL